MGKPCELCKGEGHIPCGLCSGEVENGKPAYCNVDNCDFERPGRRDCPMCKGSGEESQAGRDVAFFREMRREVVRGRGKFPGRANLTLALAEELGEVFSAHLAQRPAEAKSEAAQVAAVALRVGSEGDADFEGPPPAFVQELAELGRRFGELCRAFLDGAPAGVFYERALEVKEGAALVVAACGEVPL
jgi:hypothetical protein